MAALDATVQQTDTTTEGATLAWSEVTAEWLGAHGYKLGASVDAPWKLEEDMLTLWFEKEEVKDGVDNIWAEDMNNGNHKSKKIMLDGQLLIIRNGNVYDVTGARL